MPAVIKPKGDYYRTTDKDMCMVLMMSRFQTKEIAMGDDGQACYVYPIDDVWSVVERVLTGGASEIMFSAEDYFRAEKAWQMNLRHLSQNRRRL